MKIYFLWLTKDTAIIHQTVVQVTHCTKAPEPQNEKGRGLEDSLHVVYGALGPGMVLFSSRGTLLNQSFAHSEPGMNLAFTLAQEQRPSQEVEAEEATALRPLVLCESS